MKLSQALRSATLLVANMSNTVTPERFDSLASYWHDSQNSLRWDCIFALPPWLEVWWQEFGSTADLHLRAVRQRETVIGIAPLLLREEKAFLLGSDDVCDCLDFIVAPGSEHDFFQTLLDDLKQNGIRRLNLKPLRPDSTALTYLMNLARDQGCEVSCKVEDVSLELDLPPTWEDYLGILTQKQRHELRRKLKRLGEAGNVNYCIVEESKITLDTVDIFFKLLRKSKHEKATFMNTQRESFFRSLIKAMAQAQLLRFGILELDNLPVATVMCFDYNDTVYLYNSGYDPQFSSLSVGILSKVMCIKDSIERGKKRFDFLKGDEAYKYHLGGKVLPLYSCEIAFK